MNGRFAGTGGVSGLGQGCASATINPSALPLVPGQQRVENSSAPASVSGTTGVLRLRAQSGCAQPPSSGQAQATAYFRTDPITATEGVPVVDPFGQPLPISGLPTGGAGAVGRRRAAHGVALPAPGGEGSSAGSRPGAALICAGNGSRGNAWAKHLPSLAAIIPEKPTARNIFDGLGVFQSADRCD